MSKLKIALIAAGVAMILALGAVAIFYKVAVPKLAEQTMRAKLASLERDANLKIKTGEIVPDGAQGVIIHDFEIDEPGQDKPLVKIKRLRVLVNRAQLLAGNKVVSGVEIEQLEVNLVRSAKGTLNVMAMLDRLKAARDKDKSAVDDGTTPQALEDPKARTARHLRIFGGKWPEVDLNKATINFISEDPAQPMPIERLSLDALKLVRADDGASFETTLKLIAQTNTGWSFPEQIKLKGKLGEPLEQSALAVSFDRPLLAAGLPPYPFVEFGFSSLQIEPGAIIRINDITLDTAFGAREAKQDQAPLFAAKQLQVKLKAWVLSPRQLGLDELKVISPHATLRYNKRGAGDLEDLLYAIRPPQASYIEQRTKRLAERIAKARQEALAQQKGTPQPAEDDELGDEEQEEQEVEATNTAPTGPKAKILALLKDERLQRLIPDRVLIEDGQLQIHDKRALPVLRPSKVLRVNDIKLHLAHDPTQGTIDGDGEFIASADGDQRRGQGTMKLKMDYHQLALKADLALKALDLSWLAQLAGPRLAKKLRGGIFDIKLKIDQTRQGTPILFEGEVSLTRGYLLWERLAEEAIEGWSFSYNFAGKYAPDAPVITPTLSKPEAPLLGKGALTFTRGELESNGIKAQITPSLYGLDTTAKLPALFTLRLKLPKTPVQRALETIPAAMLGELATTKLAGTVSWDMLLEVPLNEASSMAWNNEPIFDDVEIISMPDSMDVRKMTRAFTHTIEDEKVNFKRTVRIPSMGLVPAEWLMLNANLSLDDIDAQRRRADWFEPDREADHYLADSPDYWTSRFAKAQASPKPWSPQDMVGQRQWKPNHTKDDKPMVSAPYGPYIYVPLHHISQWMVRAILTTEDNSFFKHDGFNRHALRESIQRNIRVGDYARGASTISMQTIKNLFLTRKKVMARKLQEAMLVYLMESVVHVPKARILEIYMNIIEFAPGVFGIHDAAIHYFGKRPSELTLAECAWLVTIVPGPKKYHSHWMRGEISDRFWDRIKRYIRIIYTRERATELEYQEAIATKPSFYKPTDPAAPALKPIEQPILPTFNLEPLGTTEGGEELELLPVPTPNPTTKPTMPKPPQSQPPKRMPIFVQP